VDLPTYTNIWRIEKRLYKLYDFRLPAPLPITWIGVFVGITVPYVLFLIAVGLPFNHNLVWLYVLPPGVLTWLTTRPVIESKRLPELVGSQLRYIAEPRTWCRMAPFAEKDEILVTARVWHSHPPKARPKRARKAAAKAQPAVPELQLAGVEAEELASAEVRPVKARRPATRLSAARPLVARQKASPPAAPAAAPATAGPLVPLAEHVVPLPEHEHVPVQERAPARHAPQRAKAQPEAHPEAQPEVQPAWSPWPFGPETHATSRPPAGQRPGPDQPAAWTAPPPPDAVPDTRALEVAHDSDPGFRDLDEMPASFGPASWPSPGANLLPLVRPRPESAPFPEAGPFPEVGPFPEAGAGAEPDTSPEPDASPQPDPSPEPVASMGPVASTEPAPTERPDSSEPGSTPRSGPWTGPARRHLTGLMPNLGRRPDRSSGSPQPAAEAPPVAYSAPATNPGRPQPPEATAPDAPVPAAPAKPRARWMLRAQERPASSAAHDRPPPLVLPPAPPAPPELRPAPPALPELRPAPSEVPPAASAPEAQASQAVAQAPQAQAPQAEAQAPQAQAAPAEAPAPQAPPIAARVVGVERERERPLPSIERALSGPGSRDEMGWRRQVKVVAGGQGPGKRDQEALDRDRARLPLAGSYRIVVLGCTRGAGQTVTALMTGHILAAVRGVPVAALDLTPGPTSLAARRPPDLSVRALLAGQEAGQEAEQRPAQDVRLDVIASLPANGAAGNGAPGNGNGNGAHPLDSADFRRLADLLAERYPLTMIDPAPSGLTRVLARADQLVLVAPASPDAATSLANTQQWLGAHGYGELAARAVTVVNGVSRRTKDDVLRAESVARGRCRAIVRVPWDDLLSSRQVSLQQATPQTMQPQTRLAYTALAGVLISGLAATNTPNTMNAPSAVPGRNPGEHAD
jgi:cellulose biosynthesis protein BcsQ